MLAPTQVQKTARMCHPTQDKKAARMSPPTQSQKTAECLHQTNEDQDTAMCLPAPGYCDVFSPMMTMLQCVFFPLLDTAMCSPPPAGYCDVIFSTIRQRMMWQCVLSFTQQATEQAVMVKKVDQHPLPSPEAEQVIHTVEKPAHQHSLHTHPYLGDCSTPHVLHLLLPGLVHSLPRGDDVVREGPVVIDVFPLPSVCCDVFPQSTRCCEESFKPSVVCCCEISLRRRMMQLVLSSAQQVAEEAVAAQKVDQHALPPPGEDAQAVEEALHHPPNTVQVSPSLPYGDIVCDQQLVIDEQGGKVKVRVFLLPHILRRFFPQQFLPSFSYLGKPPPPCPLTLLHIPQPSTMPMARATDSLVAVYPPRPCVFPNQVVQVRGVFTSSVSVVGN